VKAKPPNPYSGVAYAQRVARKAVPWLTHWIAGFIAISLLLAVVMAWITGLSFWVCWLMSIVSVKVNGMIAAWEDDRPGGFTGPPDSD
jgi:hypothetical protein